MDLTDDSIFLYGGQLLHDPITGDDFGACIGCRRVPIARFDNNQFWLSEGCLDKYRLSRVRARVPIPLYKQDSELSKYGLSRVLMRV